MLVARGRRDARTDTAAAHKNKIPSPNSLTVLNTTSGPLTREEVDKKGNFPTNKCPSRTPLLTMATPVGETFTFRIQVVVFYQVGFRVGIIRFYSLAVSFVWGWPTFVSGRQRNYLNTCFQEHVRDKSGKSSPPAGWVPVTYALLPLARKRTIMGGVMMWRTPSEPPLPVEMKGKLLQINAR